jgi:hypothetical protein
MAKKYDDIVVGDTVQWFTGGSKDNLPCAAIVTIVNTSGMLNLCVINQDGFPQHKVGVFPVGHQTLRDNPHLSARNGAWDYRRPPVVAEAASDEPPFDGGTVKPALKKKDSPQAASV